MISCLLCCWGHFLLMWFLFLYSTSACGNLHRIMWLLSLKGQAAFNEVQYNWTSLMWQRRISERPIQRISLVLFITFIRPIASQESNHPHCKQVVGPRNGVLTGIMWLICHLLVARKNHSWGRERHLLHGSVCERAFGAVTRRMLTNIHTNMLMTKKKTFYTNVYLEIKSSSGLVKKSFDYQTD